MSTHIVQLGVLCVLFVNAAVLPGSLPWYMTFGERRVIWRDKTIWLDLSSEVTWILSKEAVKDGRNISEYLDPRESLTFRDIGGDYHKLLKLEDVTPEVEIKGTYGYDKLTNFYNTGELVEGTFGFVKSYRGPDPTRGSDGEKSAGRVGMNRGRGNATSGHLLDVIFTSTPHRVLGIATQLVNDYYFRLIGIGGVPDACIGEPYGNISVFKKNETDQWLFHAAGFSVDKAKSIRSYNLVLSSTTKYLWTDPKSLSLIVGALKPRRAKDGKYFVDCESRRNTNLTIQLHLGNVTLPVHPWAYIDEDSKTGMGCEVLLKSWISKDDSWIAGWPFLNSVGIALNFENDSALFFKPDLDHLTEAGESVVRRDGMTYRQFRTPAQ